MFRLSALVLGLLLAISGFSPAVAAQSGQEAVIPGTDGGELARVSVEEIVDPFETYDPSYPPIRGYHYVLLTMTVENTGSRPLQIDPGDLLLRDVNGFLYGDSPVYREQGPTEPDLENQELAAGTTVSGAVGFQVLNSVDLAELLVIPDSGQLVQLMDFDAADPAPLGNEVVLVASEGGAIGTVVADEFADPYEEYPADSPPGRGSHYAMLAVTIANTGARPMQIDPNAILLQGSDGFLYGPGSVPRPDDAAPELEYQDLAPGDEVSGTVGYEVISGVQIWRMLYQPANDRLLVLADLSDGTEDRTDPDGEATASSDGAAGEVDCAEIEEWLIPVSADAAAVFSVVSSLMIMRIEEDSEFVTVAHQAADAFFLSAEALQDGDAPADVAVLNQELADAYTAYGTALEALAVATEQDDQDAIDEASRALFDAEPALITATQEVAALAATCGIETDE